jgi:hypothetical protein
MIPRLRLVSLVAALSATTAVSAYAQVCIADLVLLNQARRVAGDISEECGDFTTHRSATGESG